MERRLAAILAADVVGYSRLMEQDEAGTFERARQRRTNLVEPAIARHRGRIFKLVGDGMLAEFGSAVDAVECAAAIQKAMSEANGHQPENRRIELRIGIHVGDVILEGEDRHGDAVNVAARLQQIAKAGGICVSRRVMGMAHQKVALGFDLLGEEKLKNMSEAMAIYAVRLDGAPSQQAPPLPNKPSIAVLPFNNLSGDPEQDYFADGVVEEIITALSRMRWLFVIARNSSFTYKGRPVDVKQVGRELGVRYVLEGSVRKAGNKVRITGQLVDAAAGVHLWADRFDGALEDIFDLQDQVTAKVVSAIAPRLETAEIERAQRKPTESLDAYDYYLRGMAGLHQWSREGNNAALVNFHRAIEIDPKFALAHAMAARCFPQRKGSGWVVDKAREAAEAERLARRAVELGGDDALALSTAGFVIGYIARDFNTAAVLIERGLQLNANMAWGWLYGAWLGVWRGDPDLALERIDRAMRLSPHDPQFFVMQGIAAYAHYVAGRYAEALSWAERAVFERSDYVTGLRVLAASAAMTGHDGQASDAIARLRELDADLHLSNLRDVVPLQKPEDLSRMAEGLRKAGLPE